MKNKWVASAFIVVMAVLTAISLATVKHTSKAFAINLSEGQVVSAQAASEEAVCAVVEAFSPDSGYTVRVWDADGVYTVDGSYWSDTQTGVAYYSRETYRLPVRVELIDDGGGVYLTVTACKGQVTVRRDHTPEGIVRGVFINGLLSVGVVASLWILWAFLVPPKK